MASMIIGSRSGKGGEKISKYSNKKLLELVNTASTRAKDKARIMKELTKRGVSGAVSS